MTIEFVMTDKEVKDNIQYGLIWMTRFGMIWNTMHRKLLWEKEFTEIERLKAEKIFCQAYRWCVGCGVPKTVRMDASTFMFWKKIEAFCASL